MSEQVTASPTEHPTVALFKLPYADRRLITFVDADVVKEMEAAYQKKVEAERAAPRSTGQVVTDTATDVGVFALKVLIMPWLAYEIYKGISAGTKKVIDLLRTTSDKGVDIRPVPKEWCGQFTLPPGHPRSTVIYAAHPAVPAAYIPIAEFHRVVLEHKFCELLMILTSLGATRITVSYVQGWGLDATLKAAMADAAVASSGKEHHGKHTMVFEGDFDSGNRPSIPTDVHWLEHEPTWRYVAYSRTKGKAKSVKLSLSYNEDYGINAALEAKIKDSGFDFGGMYKSHQATTWEIKADFTKPDAGGVTGPPAEAKPAEPSGAPDRSGR